MPQARHPGGGRRPDQEHPTRHHHHLQGPLPDHIIAALSVLFELDDDGVDTLDNSLLQHAGAAVADLAPLEEVAD